MDPFISALVLAGFAGLALPIGGALAWIENIRDAELHKAVLSWVTSFGGGALLSAVALVLIPEGTRMLTPMEALFWLGAGGLAFYWIDKGMSRGQGSLALLFAMLLDFLPEALALGAMLSAEDGTALLLALMIFLQNVPEGFAAFRDIWRCDSPAWHVLLLFVGLAALGPLCAAVGLIWLEQQSHILDVIMVFASGGILYLLLQDIAPKVHEAGSTAPSLGVVAGFALGLAGHLLIG
ncbi:ZIP family metal transporter [Pseudophaeobacter sp. A-200-2]|uniref:ZIP family metal transporter n=1 Tax=Pseudophaeobacter sp. A-200-2 TaxID=3098145 RepID=UPI0034D4330A